jgi:hypothetical protein
MFSKANAWPEAEVLETRIILAKVRGRRPSIADGWIAEREDGRFAYVAGTLPNGLTLEAELAVRDAMVAAHDLEARRAGWLDSADPLERIDEALLRTLVQRIDEGRAPRSNRRVVRSASSRGDPDPEPEPAPLARHRRAVAGWSG